MWFLLSSVLLFAQPQSALQGGLQALSAQDDQLRRYRDESYLLSQPISASVFRNLLVFSTKTQRWEAAESSAEPSTSARVRVVHLWAHYCEPCQREFPVLKGLAQKAAAKHKGRVQYLFVAEDTPSEQMSTFLQKNKPSMPEGRHFHDTQGQLRSALQLGLPTGELKLPTTILVDEQGVVRQAFVGPLVEPTDRRPELLAAIDRLLSLP